MKGWLGDLVFGSHFYLVEWDSFGDGGDGGLFLRDLLP